MSKQNKEVAVSKLELAEVKGTPVGVYVLNLDDMRQHSNVVIKSNVIVDMELYGQDDLTLHGVDVQVLSTSFLMAQCLKQQRKVFDANTKFQIPLHIFCEMWKIPFDPETKKDGYIYREVRDSISRLNLRNFVYPDVQRLKMVESGYYSHIEYDQTTVAFSFPPPIIEYINQDKDFTWYFLENILKLQESSITYRVSQYATLLYEHIQKNKFQSMYDIQKRNIIDIKTEQLKTLMGIDVESYKRHIDFRNKVLDQAVKFIQDRIGMTIEIENLSLGRKGVYGYRFTTYMTAEDLDFKDAVAKSREKALLTNLQAKKYATLLLSLPSFDNRYRGGEPALNFIPKLKERLGDNDFVVEIEPYLRAVGFASKKLSNYIEKMDDEAKREIYARRGDIGPILLELDLK